MKMFFTECKYLEEKTSLTFISSLFYNEKYFSSDSTFLQCAGFVRIAVSPF